MQLLAKFKNILYIRFRASLNSRKFKVALNPMYRILYRILYMVKLFDTGRTAFVV